MALEITPSETIGRLSWRWLTGLFTLAFALRLLFLGRADVWCDEILFMNLSTPPLTPFDAMREHWRLFLNIGHLPAVAMLQSAALWILRPFTGASADAFWLRMPSALWSALTVIPLAQLGALMGGKRVGMMTGLIFATFMFPVFYGREVYYYAGLVLFVACGTYGWFSLAADASKRRSWRWLCGTTIALGAAASGHVSGVLVPIALTMLSLAWSVRTPKEISRADVGRLALVAVIGICPAIPFYWQRIEHKSPMNFSPVFSYGTIIADGLGKQFFGTHPILLGLAAVLLLAGVVSVFARDDGGRFLRIGMLVTTIIILAGILVGAHGSLYFARYFNAVNGLLYLLTALGLAWFFKLIFRARGETLAIGAAGVGALAHLAIFLPVMYVLPAKGVNYGGIARWLNDKLPPGTPYVMESGYELRFVSEQGYFRTPNLVAACPYVHGGESNAVQILWQRQTKFFQEYPEAVYVESAHHGAEPGSKYGIFKWPREHFKNKVDIRNDALSRLGQWGIWPQAVDDTTIMAQSLSTIYYNTQADNDALAKAAGKNIVFDFPGWRVTQIQQYVYARVAESTQGSIIIRNLASSNLTGILRLPVGLYAPSTPYQIDVLWQGQVAGSLPITGGSIQAMNTQPMVFKPGANELRLRVGHGDAAQMKAIIVPGVEFVPAPPT